MKEIEYGDKVADVSNNAYGVFVGYEYYNNVLMGLIYSEVSKFAIRVPFRNITRTT